MDPHTREALGRLARWIALPSAVIMGVAAVAALMGGLRHSLAAGRNWSVTPDVLSKCTGILTLRVHSNTPLRPEATGFYWYGPDGQLRNPGVGRGITYYQIPEGTRPGIFPVRNVVNPYARYAPGLGRCSAHLYAKGTQVALLDVAGLLAVTDQGRLPPDARDLWRRRSASVPLAQLAAARPLAYLVPVALADYDRSRDILRQAPVGAVIAGGPRYDVRPSTDEIVAQLVDVSRRVGERPILLTENAALAAAARAARIPVVLVGVDVATATEKAGANVADWPAAAAYLAD